MVSPIIPDDVNPHGPRVVDAFKHPPVMLIIMWAVCGVAWLAMCIINIKHHKQLKAAMPSILRHCYLDIIRLAMVFGTSAYFTLFNLRPAYLFELIRKFYEAYVLHTFFIILISLLGGFNQAVIKFKQQGSSAFLAVPPLGCCFRLCCRKSPVTRDVLVWCTRGTEQYVYVVVLTCVWDLWEEIDPPIIANTAKNISMVLSMVSMLVAVYALFILFFLSRRLLAHHKPGLKFLSIKAVLFMSSFQSLVLRYLMPVSEDKVYDTETHVRMWESSLLVIESLILAILLWKAFPSSDLAPMPDLSTIRASADHGQGLGKSVSDLESEALLGNTVVVRMRPDSVYSPPPGTSPLRPGDKYGAIRAPMSSTHPTTNGHGNGNGYDNGGSGGTGKWAGANRGSAPLAASGALPGEPFAQVALAVSPKTSFTAASATSDDDDQFD